MLNKIVIYDGEGVSQLLRQTLLSQFKNCKTLSAKDLIETDWDQSAKLLIIPGGRDRPYHRDLKGAGNQKIRRFVEAGGIYLGICAGAYYACSLVDFERGHPNEIIEERELQFFSGNAIGPAYGLGLYDATSTRGARLAKLELGSVYFHGGPTFQGDFTNVEILARYLDLPDQPPAIISCPVGKGRAILSGVHVEKNKTIFSKFLRKILTTKIP